MVNEIPKQEVYNKVKELAKNCLEKGKLGQSFSEVEIEKYLLNGKEALELVIDLAEFTPYCKQLKEERAKASWGNDNYKEELKYAFEEIEEIIEKFKGLEKKTIDQLTEISKRINKSL